MCNVYIKVEQRHLMIRRVKTISKRNKRFCTMVTYLPSSRHVRGCHTRVLTHLTRVARYTHAHAHTRESPTAESRTPGF